MWDSRTAKQHLENMDKSKVTEVKHKSDSCSWGRITNSLSDQANETLSTATCGGNYIFQKAAIAQST